MVQLFPDRVDQVREGADECASCDHLSGVKIRSECMFCLTRVVDTILRDHYMSEWVF